MTGRSKTTPADARPPNPEAGYSSENELVDYILGITFEIWEQGRIDNIHDYYAREVEVYSLDGMTTSAKEMVDKTHSTFASYPNRLLIADDVITSGSAKKGFSSHRIISPMTNLGNTAFGPATGREIQSMNIADCEVNDGLITREWLVRDNLAVTKQLGFNPLECSRVIAQQFDDRQTAWLSSEFARTTNARPASVFAQDVLENCWIKGDNKTLESVYAPYCVLKRAPLSIYSGRKEVLRHYADWRGAFPDACLSIDHVCSQPFDENNQRIAVRWSVAAYHKGEFVGRPASGKPVYIMGVTHWQMVDGRIAAEWTVIDELAVLAQTQV
jgi:steroid delta-isomerase-like uncharacterized protein